MSTNSGLSGAVPPARFAPFGAAPAEPPSPIARSKKQVVSQGAVPQQAVPKWGDEVEVYKAVPVAEPVVAPPPYVASPYIPPVTTPAELEDEVLNVRRMVVASGVSMIVNMLLLILLGLIAATPPARDAVFLVELDVSASAIDDGPDQAPQMKLEKPPTPAVDRPAGGALTSRLALIPQPTIAAKPPGLNIGPPVITGMIGGDLPGAGTVAGPLDQPPGLPGDGGVAQFFGVQASGKKIAFVVDSSGSMSGDRFTRCRTDLIESLRGLTAQQYYFVVLFSDVVIPMPPRHKQLALTSNVRQTIKWLEKREAEGNTEPVPGIKAALQQNPDAIYLLTDGSFADGTVAQILALQKRTKLRVPIHTIAFENADGEADLQAIAQETGGTYRFIE
jgi:hypothetical protein